MNRRPNLPYLKQVLVLDPRSSAERIVLARNRALGLASGHASPRPLQSAGAVASAQSALNAVRQQFWTLPLAELDQRLVAIDVGPYPELSVVVKRLQQAAAVRSEFPKLAVALQSNLALFNNLKSAITLPPRDLAGMKEAVLRAIFRGEHTKVYKRAAKLIKSEFPQIYAMESQWLDEILGVRAHVSRWSLPSLTVSVPGWVWIILAITLLRVLSSLGR